MRTARPRRLTTFAQWTTSTLVRWAGGRDGRSPAGVSGPHRDRLDLADVLVVRLGRGDGDREGHAWIDGRVVRAVRVVPVEVHRHLVLLAGRDVVHAVGAGLLGDHL